MTSGEALAVRVANTPKPREAGVVYRRIWSFRTQEQYDLWANSVQEDFRSGKRSSTLGYRWLWCDSEIVVIDASRPTALIAYGGDKAKCNVGPIEDLMDRNYMSIYTMNGFEYGDRRAVRAAWNEIRDAIRGYREYSQELREKYIIEPRKHAVSMVGMACEQCIDSLVDSGIVRRDGMQVRITSIPSSSVQCELDEGGKPMCIMKTYGKLQWIVKTPPERLKEVVDLYIDIAGIDKNKK